MNRSIPLALVGLALVFPPRGGQRLHAQVIDTLALREHTRFLSDDALLGRATGSAGERTAADYIARRLADLGIRPVTGPSWLLPVPLREATIEPATSLEIRRRSRTATFRPDSDFIVSTGGRNAFRDFDGRALLAGSAEQARHALESVSIRGTVLVVAGTLGAQADTLVPDWIERGVAGVILLVPDSADYRLFARSRGAARYFADGDVDDPIWQPDLPMLIGGPSVTSALLGGVDLPDAAFTADPMRAVDLDRSVKARIRTRQADISTANVAGMLPGSDPARRGEYVVFTAHYDHLGVGEADPNGDSIYNGFSDNAAGVAMLLAIAQATRAAPPPRSLVFVFLTGEERGLLGSSWLAAHPPVPLERIAALINLDAGAPPVPPVSWRIAGGAGTPLGAVAAAIADEHGWTAHLSAASPNSDYWPFLARGVPSIFIIPGNEWENTTVAQRDSLRTKWDHYHQPSDAWLPDFPFSGLARYARFAVEIGLRMASGPARGAR